MFNVVPFQTTELSKKANFFNVFHNLDRLVLLSSKVPCLKCFGFIVYIYSQKSIDKKDSRNKYIEIERLSLVKIDTYIAECI